MPTKHEQQLIAHSATNLLALDEQSLSLFVEKLGWPRYRTAQVLRWLYQRGARTIDQMTDLSLAERRTLQTIATIRRSTDCQVFRSTDDTRKLVLTLKDGLNVEAVLIPDHDRLTLCLSTQVGCTLD